VDPLSATGATRDRDDLDDLSDRDDLDTSTTRDDVRQ
jgi:hypothetical protein